MSIFTPLFDKFRRIPLSTRVRDAHHQACIDLLEAEAHFEEIEAKRDYLRRRVARLSPTPPLETS